MDVLMITSWYGCPDPDLCEDPECTNPAHLPDREWSEADEAGAWLWDDDRARRRDDV